MREYLKEAALSIASDEVLQEMHVNAFSVDDKMGEKLLQSTKGGIVAELRSLGFSQMNAASTLSIFHFFGIVLRVKNTLVNEKLNLSCDIDAAAERIVALLHHKRLAEIMAIFSKCLRVHESHNITLNSRILKVEVGKDEKVALILFYSSRLPLSQIQTIIDGTGEGGSVVGGFSTMGSAGMLGGVWD